jgi:hypothetical protein
MQHTNNKNISSNATLCAKEAQPMSKNYARIPKSHDNNNMQNNNKNINKNESNIQENFKSKVKHANQRLVFPASAEGRLELLQEIYKTLKPIHFEVEIENPLYRYMYQYNNSTNSSNNNHKNNVEHSYKNNLTNVGKKIVNKKHQFLSLMHVLPIKYIIWLISEGLFSIQYIALILSPTVECGYTHIEDSLEQTMAELSNENRYDIILRLFTLYPRTALFKFCKFLSFTLF